MDIKMLKLQASWSENPDGWKVIEKALTGLNHRGLRFRRLGQGSSKLLIQKGEENRKVPLKWLYADKLEAIGSQIVVGNGDKEVSSLEKLWIMGKDVPKFMSITDSLVKKPENMIRISWSGKTVVPAIQANPIKPKDAAMGMYVPKPKTSVFCIPSKDGKFYAVLGKEAKKALAREDKLVQQSSDCIPLPKQHGFVIEHVPEGDLRKMFGMGAAFASPDLIKEIGHPRVTAPIGVKAVLAEMPIGLCGLDDGLIVLSKSAWKSGLNGVLAALVGDVRKAMVMSRTDADLMLAVHKQEIMVGDHVLKGWVVPLDGLVVTNPYSLCGLKWKDQEDTSDEEDMLDDNSPYTIGHGLWKGDPEGFSPIQWRKEMRSSGAVVNKSNRTDIKAMSLDVIRGTYGPDVSDNFISSIVEESGVYKEESMGLLTDSLSCKVMDGEVIKYLARVVFGGIRVSPMSFDPSSMDGITLEEGARRLGILMQGDDVWPGVVNLKPTIVKLYGQEFFIPGYDTMKKFITDPKDGGLIFSGPMSDLLLLVLAAKNKRTNWKSKARQHKVSVSSSLTGKTLDKISVRGRSFVIVPGFWLKRGEVCVPYGARDIGIKNGDICTYAKSPVLFGGAIAGVKVYTGLPKAYYGETTYEERAHYEGVMFVSPDTLLANHDDCDGDMAALYVTKAKLPIEGERGAWQEPWNKEYSDDELNLDLTWSDYGIMDANFNGAIEEILENEAMIGGGTNSLLILSHMLQMWTYENPKMELNGRIIRDMYAQELQNCISGMKHDVHGADFSEIRMQNAFNLEARGIWIHGMKALVEGFVSEEDMELFIDFVLSMDPHMHGLFSRRNPKEVSLGTPARGEDAMAVIDVFTKSVSRISADLCPSHGTTMESLLNEDANANDIFMKRYCLLGQDLSRYALGTTRGSVLRKVKELRSKMVAAEEMDGSMVDDQDDNDIDMSLFC